MTATAVPYQAHCIWCGRDADAVARKRGHCARCGGALLLELDFDRRAGLTPRHPPRRAVRERKPRRRPLAESLQT